MLVVMKLEIKAKEWTIWRCFIYLFIIIIIIIVGIGSLSRHVGYRLYPKEDKKPEDGQ